MTHVKSLTQAEIERLTGLSREVLRKWELRYGFPEPVRGVRGKRHYNAQDVHKLLLLSRLLRGGMRAGAIVPLAPDQLQALLDAPTGSNGMASALDTRQITSEVSALLTSLLQGHPAHGVGSFLRNCLARHGLPAFVSHLMPAFNQAVGHAWLAGRLSVAAEHHFSSELRQTVLRALPEAHHIETQPRVLLTTPPGELHSLGLLALHAQLRLNGATVIDLDCQTPLPVLLQAVQDWQVGVVAISASVCMPSVVLQQFVDVLAEGLPDDCVLWLGGNGCQALTPAPNSNWKLFNDVQSAVAQWRNLALAQRKNT